MASYRQFIVVQFVPEADEQGQFTGKTNKFPINPSTGLRHDAHDASIWLDVSTAATIAAAFGAQFSVGFVLTAADPFVCLDVDKCRTDVGWSEHALSMQREFPAATEVSNSGNGWHQWGIYRGVAPPHRKRAPKVNGVDYHMELYTEKRFIAFGPHGASGQMYDLTDLLPGFIAKWFPPAPEGEIELDGFNAPDPNYTPLTDDELFTKARASVPKQDASAVFGGAPPMASFSDLFDRNVDVLARVFPPQTAGKEFNYSDADAALAKELAYWTGRDAPRIARLMQLSALRREKWNQSIHRTYFGDTIANGIGRCKAVYRIKPVLPAPPPPAPAGTVSKPLAHVITHNTFVGRDDIVKVFDGCVYIRDLNEVLLPNGDLVDQARFKVEYAGYAFSLDNQNEKTTKDAWDAFINNQIVRFPRVEGTMFDPAYDFQDVIERAGRRWANVYKKPVVDRRPGDVTPFMNLLHKLLPNGDDAIILLSYMAAVVQNPGLKFRWAPFIQGVEGNGKSTIVACLKHALGNKYVFSVKAGMIENGFNAWLEHNILYVADDIYSSKDRTDMMEALKSLITETDQAITLKGVDAIQKRICGNFIFTDNHKDAMQKRDATRRICTLYCAQQSKYDRSRDGLTKEYFVGRNGLIPWLKREGFAAVAEMLHTMAIDERYNPAGECQEAPDTSVTQEAIIDGRTGIEHEVAEWIELGEPGFCGNFVSANMLKLKLRQTPQFSKFASHLKLKETMLRLGYETHRGMEGGRCATNVQPDGMRPVLYVKADSFEAELKGATEIATRYEQAQQAAITASIERRFQHGT